MPPLPDDLRKQLAKAIQAARLEAEAGARKALEALAVERHEPHSSMSPEERLLRNRLRARGRQLGDVRDKVRGSQAVERLVHEVAYEHWHRMLFARFLAENHLLIEPNSGVAITMAECEELAREAGEDPHDMAARFAQDSLPQIFRSGDPVLEVAFAPETRQALDKWLDGLPPAVFAADDSLGWTYQYWRTEEKKAINAAGNRIGADELPAVTQLFTEHYMVLFLYHNTIGAWHAGKVLAANPSLAETVQSEEQLRQAVRLRSQGGYDFEYLRFVREPTEGEEEDTPTGPWRAAAGTFEGWPETARELKVLDPCCGSGHFLAEGFELLVRLRVDEEGLGLEEAIRRVLTDNLFGLEIDPRCTQIAAFNLAMAAWKMADGPIELPPLHIACSGLALGSSEKEWTALAGDDGRLRAGAERLFDLFEQAPEFGSLIDPKALKSDLLVADFAELHPLLQQALAREGSDVEATERAVAAQGMAKAAELLLGEYTLVTTNVPYLGRGQQSGALKSFADEPQYKDANGDLATIFVARMLRWLGQAGTTAAVTPQSWLFMTSYRKLRNELLKRRTWNLVARLGPRAFDSISGEVVNVALPVISGSKPSEEAEMAGLDATAGTTPMDKATLLRGGHLMGPDEGRADGAMRLVAQAEQLKNPDARISLQSATGGRLLLEICRSFLGLGTGDLPKYVRRFWEIPIPVAEWAYYQRPVGRTCPWGGADSVVCWDTGIDRVRGMSAQERAQIHNQDQSGQQAWGRAGISVSLMGTLRASLFTGARYDKGTTALIPKEPSVLPALWCYCQDPRFNSDVREIDANVMCSSGAVVKVRFDEAHWEKVAASKYPNGVSDEPQSDDPTQWFFHGHPAKEECAAVLQVSVARLLGYRWPAEIDAEMRLSAEAREWTARCDELKEVADEDGIVCLSATRGERSAADRLREWLVGAFGSNWSAAKERELLAAAVDGKKHGASLEVWLRDRFFEEHCKLFHYRPFVWHIWDGNNEGFHCLVNAHRLTGPHGEGRRTLEAITYSYLGDWIDRQRADERAGKEGADGRLAAAQDLQGQLAKILEGEPPYDLFVRWKPLHEQAMGWEPDINDGVRLNIRPFMKAELRKGGKKGAGVLRWKPNIKWTKDRGKEPQSLRPRKDFPWFWGVPSDASTADRIDFLGGDDFDGNRWNDLHYTLACKKAARERAARASDS